MKTYRLVIGINFTECAINAAKYALALIKPFGGQVRLVFCLTDFVAVTDLSEELGDMAGEDQPLWLRYEKRLAQLVDDLKPLAGRSLTIEAVVRHGYPEDELPKEKETFGADFLVVGLSAGVDGLPGFLGSKTADIVRKASGALLTVPVATSPKNAKLSKVIYVTDFRLTEFSSFHQLVAFLPERLSRVYCLHYCHIKPDEYDNMRLNELQRYCTETYRNQEVVCKMLVGDNAMADLSAYIESHGIELIAMTRRHRNAISQWFHPDVAQKMLYHTTIPFMLFCD